MSDVNLIIIGAVIAFMAYFSWRERNPNMLYIMAGFAVIGGVESYTSYIGPIRKETIDALGVAIGLGLLGFVVSKRS